jgi:hypothetical protein
LHAAFCDEGVVCLILSRGGSFFFGDGVGVEFGGGDDA